MAKIRLAPGGSNILVDENDAIATYGTDAEGVWIEPTTKEGQDTANTALGLIQAAMQALAANGIIVKRAKVDAAANGDNELVAAVSGNKIKVLGMFVVVKEAVDITFYSAAQASGTKLTGTMSFTDYEGWVLPAPLNPAMHWIETAVAEKLNLYLSDAKQVSGCLVYYEEA